LIERRFDTGKVEINYGEGPPNGPPFVILHGGSGSWRYADAFIDLLKERWHIYAPDFRGHGDSGHVPGRYAMRDYADDIIGFLASIVREPAVLFGHSLGGEVAIMVAAQRVDLVRADIHGDVPLSRKQHSTQEDNLHRAHNKLWHKLAGKPEAEIEIALRDMLIQVPGADGLIRAEDVLGKESAWFPFHASNLHRLDPDVLVAVLAGPDVMLDGYDPETLLPAITCPVLILQADPAAGAGMSDEEVDLGLKLLPDAKVVRLQGIDHSLHALHSQEILDAITPFLSQVAQRESQVRSA
jgi:pimeloyl-ACP methyl ester carboxylesterase